MPWLSGRPASWPLTHAGSGGGAGADGEAAHRPPGRRQRAGGRGGPGLRAGGARPGAGTWASTADADSGDADLAAAFLFPVNTHATDAWPATPHLGIWHGAALVASSPIVVQPPGPGARIRLPLGTLDWSIPIA